MLDIRWTFVPYKKGRPASDLLAYLKSAFIWSREAFLLFEQEKSLYNGFNSVSSVSTVSLDMISTVSIERCMRIAPIYILLPPAMKVGYFIGFTKLYTRTLYNARLSSPTELYIHRVLN